MSGDIFANHPDHDDVEELMIFKERGMQPHPQRGKRPVIVCWTASISTKAMTTWTTMITMKTTLMLDMGVKMEIAELNNLSYIYAKLSTISTVERRNH